MPMALSLPSSPVHQASDRSPASPAASASGSRSRNAKARPKAARSVSADRVVEVPQENLLADRVANLVGHLGKARLADPAGRDANSADRVAKARLGNPLERRVARAENHSVPSAHSAPASARSAVRTSFAT